MKIFTKLLLFVALAFLMVACAEEFADSSATAPESVELGFALPIDATRTTIDTDGRSTRWSAGDKLAVWAVDAEGGYTFSNETFTLRYFSQQFDYAYFTSNIEAMDEGEYTYYMSYPRPTSVDGTMATYTLPSAQSGKYEGGYDIMIAEPVVAEALTSSKKMELNTIMRHQMHALKITVPNKASNFADRVYRLEITFPTAVVGDVTLDVTNPHAIPTYSNTSNTIVVNSDEGFAVGSDIWVFVLPGTVSGDVSYKITGLEQRSEVATYPFERELQRGHVTPVRMAMPPFEKYTAFNFSIGENYLGEDFNSFTLYDNNGTNMGTYYRNAENKYTWEYSGEFDVTPYNNKDWTLVFDSENAVVENKVNMGTLKPYFLHNITPVDVPYILFQDFENVTTSTKDGDNNYSSSDQNQGGAALSGTLSGWNAARYWLKPGAVRVNARFQCVKIVMQFASTHYGRVDTPKLGDGTRGIRPGKSVNIKLQFDAAMYKHGTSSLKLSSSDINVAVHSNANNPIDGIATGYYRSGLSIKEYTTTLADFGTTYFTQAMEDKAGAEAFGQTFPTYTADFSVTSDSRICFYPTLVTESVDFIGNAEVNVYIDNIKVSIMK